MIKKRAVFFHREKQKKDADTRRLPLQTPEYTPGRRSSDKWHHANRNTTDLKTK